MDIGEPLFDTNVIEIDDKRFKSVRRNYCAHRSIEYDESDKTIKCADCDYSFDHFEAFVFILNLYRVKSRFIHQEYKRLQQVEKKQLYLKAAQEAERAWRRRDMVPTCPHCKEAIFAGDGFGSGLVNKEFALRRREVLKRNKHSEGV